MPVSANGTEYALSGPPGAPVLVLIHGLGLHRQIWRAYEPVLAQTFRVLQYDLYGHGKSAPPPATPSLSLFATQLRALLDEIGIRQAALLGFSLGGMVNRSFTMRYRERVTALVILNSPHERGAAAQKIVAERAAQTEREGVAATMEATLARWFSEDFRRTRADVIDEIRQWLLANDPRHYAQCRQVLANGVLELIRPQIAKPTLVITCERDSGSTPAMTQAIAAEISGAATLVIPRLQHLGLLEQPQRFIPPMLAFLQRALLAERTGEPVRRPERDAP